MFAKYRKHITYTTILCVLLLASIYIIRSNTAPKNISWKETTEPYEAICNNNCTIINNVTLGHRGGTVPLVYNPNIDDETAQWADCIGYVMQCVREKKSFEECVIEGGGCPKECVTTFKAELKNTSSRDFKSQRAVFENIFINNNGFCLPPTREFIDK